MFDHFGHFKKMILNIIKKLLIFYPNWISQKFIQQRKCDIVSKVSRIRWDDQSPLKQSSEVSQFVHFTSSIFDSLELLFEAIRNLKWYIILILPVKKHFKDRSFDACKTCTFEKNIVSFDNFLSEQTTVIVPDFVMCSNQLNQLVRTIVKHLINLEFVKFGLATLAQQFFRLDLPNGVSGSMRFRLVCWVGRNYVFEWLLRMDR